MTSTEFIKEIKAANDWLADQMFQYQSRIELSKRMLAASHHIKVGESVYVTMNDGEEFEAKVLAVTPMVNPREGNIIYYSYDLIRVKGSELVTVFNLDFEIHSICKLV